MVNNSKDELNEFKTDINLVDFCISNGYQFRKGFENKNHETTHIVVEKNDPEETLIIHRNSQSGHFTYFNPTNQLDKGTIIDFCSNKLNINLGETRKLLRKFTGSIKSTKYPIEPAPQLRPKAIDEQYFEIKPLSDPSYLKSRHISEAVLNSPLFFGTVGIKSVTTKSANSDKQIKFENTAFPIKDIDWNTIGLVLKNKTYSGTSFKGNLPESSTSGMWMSNPPKQKENVKFCLVESPINALSHFQLKFGDQLTSQANVMYFSSNGVLRESHINHVQHFIDQYKPSEVLILTDNDNAGLRFATTYLGRLRHPADVDHNVRFYKDEDVKVDCYYAKPINILDIQLFNNQKVQNKDILKNINDFFHNKNEELFSRYGLKKEEFKIENISQTDTVTDVRVHFDNRMELLHEAINITQFLRPTEHLKIDLSESKDYNQDLTNKFEGVQSNVQSLGK